MTEQEWLQATAPDPMLNHLRGKVIDRKLRLFACACCRRIWHLLSEDSRNLIEVLERREDGRATDIEISTAAGRNYEFLRATPNATLLVAARAANAAAGWGAWDAALHTVWELRKAIGDKDVAQRKVEDRVQAALLREIINNPVQPCPAFHPAILTWHGGLLVSMAQRMYDSREFSDMPVLADALEEAGCTNPDVLSHCRQQGAVHVRGCWVIDLLLKKG